MEKKLDKIQEDIGEIKVILERNTTSLEHHIKRTDMLEERIKPVEKHVNMVDGALKLIGILSLLAGIYAVFK